MSKNDYFKTKKGIISRMYHNQVKNSKKRGYELPSYTKEEFKTWINNQSNFDIIYDIWVENNYNKDFTPSIDRLDDYKPYSFNNIQLLTWKENNEKGKQDRKNGINNKLSKEVVQLNLEGIIVQIFPSVAIAAKTIGLKSYTNIADCCRGERKTAGGFKWKFNDKNRNICLV